VTDTALPIGVFYAIQGNSNPSSKKSLRTPGGLSGELMVMQCIVVRHGTLVLQAIELLLEIMSKGSIF
jgi:hypothetical protein